MRDKSDTGFDLKDIAQSAFSGAIAGIPTALLSRPILVLGTPMHTEMSHSVFGVIKDIHATYGIRGFANGLVPSLAASIPGTPLMYLGSRLTKQILGDGRSSTIVSGYVGLAAANIIYVPVTVVNQAKQTINVNRKLQSSSYPDIARTLVGQEGVRGLYRGYSLQTASFGTCNALGLFFTQEIMRVMHSKRKQTKLTSWVCYLLGYFVAGFLTNPIELVKKQTQISWANKKMFPDKTPLDTVKRTITTHGRFSLYRGASVFGLWAAARFGFGYATCDEVKKLVDKKFNR